MANSKQLAAVERRAELLRAAEERGLTGSKDRQMGGRFSTALVEEAKRVEGDFGERLLHRKGRVTKGTLFAG